MMGKPDISLDKRIILEMIAPRARVLDLGCGDGELLSLLIREKDCICQGIEIDEKAVYECVAKGVSVIHGDIDSALSEYQDGSFDYVILNQSIQQVLHLEKVLRDSLRVGRKVIVGFPNFAYYKARLQIFLSGRTPVTGSLPYAWYSTPNLHFLSISDFVEYCRLNTISIRDKAFTGGGKRVRLFPNLFAQNALFMIG